MSRSIEIEFKNIVTATEFQLLMQNFNLGKDDFFTQQNHYFDTDEFSLKALGSALRVRELPGEYELTLKKPANIGLLEINQTINEQTAFKLLNETVFPDGDVLDELQSMNINIDNLEYFGSLTTDRVEIEYKNGLLVFDHSFYLGVEDFEIEYETSDWEKGEKIFQQLMKQFNIQLTFADNKIGRFYSAKMNAQ